MKKLLLLLFAVIVLTLAAKDKAELQKAYKESQSRYFKDFWGGKWDYYAQIYFKNTPEGKESIATEWRLQKQQHDYLRQMIDTDPAARKIQAQLTEMKEKAAKDKSLFRNAAFQKKYSDLTRQLNPVKLKSISSDEYRKLDLQIQKNRIAKDLATAQKMLTSKDRKAQEAAKKALPFLQDYAKLIETLLSL